MDHKWNVSPKEAIEIQKKLQSKVKLQPLKKQFQYIAGADVSLNLFSKTLYAGIVVFSYPGLNIVDQAFVKIETSFPYIPGLLSFREIPGLVQCFNKLRIKPDMIVADGQGIAHPRRLGVASHLGVLLDIPTIGCAKSVLVGKYDKTNRPVANLLDKGEVIGAAVYTKKNCKPVIVSPGNKITLEESIEIIQKTVKGYRLPEVTRQAHIMVNLFRKGEF